ncbi:NAD(P)-binding protein [Ophiobolus disseminans]|uniref:NAD(P)-binding protein n=1 Tax=Ophiobolus disseminans TaxID=1469910 RepID=A0A6A6ZNI7_9PLEO|nr:NAD(P)-binding protein [Ophiobolus disseminans]
MASLPSHYGTSFTPTTHTTVPANIDPTTVTLPQPFVAVVTGAGKGLGWHISLAYAMAGCSGLAISSRTMEDLEALEHEIGKIAAASGKAVDVLKSVCNVQSDASVRELEENVRRRWGRVDVVIANAGVISKYVDKGGAGSNLPQGVVEDEDWARVLDINLMGVWRVSKAFTPLLLTSPNGIKTLIYSSSLAAHNSNSELCPIAYNVSKMACNRLIEHIANDHDICAFALHPGAVLTPQTQHHTGAVWDTLLRDDAGLAGAFCVWLSRERRGWLSGRYVSCNWDVDELEGMKSDIVEGDKLKFRMVV